LATNSVPPANLSRRTASGLGWLGMQALALKPINIIGNLALAWLLAPNVFGVVGMAYTVTSFVDLIQQAGVNQVLIHRHTSYRTWLNPAFWMSMTTGLLASVVVLVSAPLAAAVYDQPQLIGVLSVLAIAPPIRALALIPTAKLQIDMRFGLLAKTMVATNALQMVLAVALAALGFGVYSVVMPVPVVEAVRMVIYWREVRPRVRPNLQWNRWRYLISDTIFTMGAYFCYTVINQGDYIILALFYSDSEMGLYYFSFNLALQTLQLLSANLAKVLFPALSQLQDDRKRQTRAFIKAAELLAFIAVPGCLFQAALADDFIHALYKPDWYGAVPLLQILSIAFAFRSVGGTVGGLMMAQGRFRTMMNWTICMTFVFLVCILIGAWFSVVGAAIGVLVFSALIGPCGIYLAIRYGGGGWRDVWNIFARPMFAATISIACGWLISRAIPPLPLVQWWRMATIGLVGSGLYLAAMWFIARSQLQQLWQVSMGLIRGRAYKPPVERVVDDPCRA
jgi:O-antigen/teichoic acid export membrane protein